MSIKSMNAAKAAEGITTPAEVTLSKGIAYSLPVFVTSFLLIPTLAIIPGIYATYFGLALTSIASVLLVARLFDAITDPIIGYLSDRYRSRTGTRKPWIVVGGLCFVVSGYYLFVPPENVSISYFLVWFLAFYLSWTLIEVPHIAWGGELVSSAHGKTQIYSLRAIASNMGALVFYVLPFLPFFATSEFTAETMEWVALTTVVLMLPLLFICVKNVPDGSYTAERQPEEGFKALLHSIVHNKCLLLFLCSWFFAGVGFGMWMGTSFVFIDGYLGFGEKYPLVLTTATLIGLMSVGFWWRLSGWYGKKFAWGAGVIIIVLGFVLMGFLQPESTPLMGLIATVSLVFFGGASMNIFAPAVLSDIVDYGTWKFGVNRAATYFAVYTFMSKATTGVGAALGLGIAGWFGFEVDASLQTERGLLGARLAISYIPAFFALVSVVFIALIPINAHSHRLIQEELANRV